MWRAVRLAAFLLTTLSVPQLSQAAAANCRAEPPGSETRFGFNLKQDAAAPWGTAAARRSLDALAKLGVREVALVVFLWQETPEDTRVVLGADTKLPGLAQAIRDARAAGLCVTVKPHVWVPGHWAGEVRAGDETGIARWFGSYERALLDLADLAEREGAARFVVATELRALADRSEWPELTARVARHFHGELEWVADRLETAEQFRHWKSFSAISVSLYPAMNSGETSWKPALERSRARLTALSRRLDRPLRIAEIGVRSVDEALRAPWENPEQRRAPVNLQLQAGAYEDVLAVFDGKVASLHFWCWYTNPSIGGRRDSDFTPRGKPAEALLKQRLTARQPP